MFTTPDLCDAHPDHVRVLETPFANFGGREAFCGPVTTVRCFEDNSKVKALAGTDVSGNIMVVDGGGSTRRALLGDEIAANALRHGWAGFVIFGAVRDVEILRTLDLGVRAIAPCPVKTVKRDLGDVDVDLRFGGVTISPGGWIYADANGIVYSAHPLDV
ncbi:MAG: ribonuclease E activity regulator RraA [Pseudomonadota bacterium]